MNMKAKRKSQETVTNTYASAKCTKITTCNWIYNTQIFLIRKLLSIYSTCKRVEISDQHLFYTEIYIIIFIRIVFKMLSLVIFHITNPKCRPKPTMNVSSNKCCLCIWCIFLLCVTELHCCPKTIKTTPLSHTVKLADKCTKMFIFSLFSPATAITAHHFTSVVG